jgi:transcriptional regulator with XRE-family HTH domain
LTTAIANRVHAVSKRLSLSQDELADLVGASPRAVSRWSSGETSPQRMTKQRLLELVYVGDQLAKVLQPEDANLWIFSRNQLLHGESPAERIREGDFQSVLALIDALADGVVL